VSLGCRKRDNKTSFSALLAGVGRRSTDIGPTRYDMPLSHILSAFSQDPRIQDTVRSTASRILNNDANAHDPLLDQICDSVFDILGRLG